MEGKMEISVLDLLCLAYWLENKCYAQKGFSLLIKEYFNYSLLNKYLSSTYYVLGTEYIVESKNRQALHLYIELRAN